MPKSITSSIDPVYFFAFFPFVNFGISLFPTDTQPFYILAIVLILFSQIKNLKFEKQEITLLVLSILASIAVALFGFELKKSVNIIIVLIASIYFYRNTYNLKLIRAVLIIYILMFLFWVLAPSVAYSFQSLVVRNINSESISFRGIPVLSTEPGLYAGTAVLLIELYLLKIKKRLTKTDVLLLSLMACTVILSFSGTSLAFIALFFLVRIKKPIVFVLIIIGSVVIPGFIITLFPDTRLTYFINLLINGNLNLLLNDSSLMYRLSSLGVSLEFFVKHPFGGLGIIDLKHELQELYYLNYYNPKIGMDKNIHFVSSLGYTLVSGGILSLIFFISFIKRFFTVKGMIYFVVCASFSYSLIYPVSLILLIENSKK